jgi:hypothetical protein
VLHLQIISMFLWHRGLCYPCTCICLKGLTAFLRMSFRPFNLLSRGGKFHQVTQNFNKAKINTVFHYLYAFLWHCISFLWVLVLLKILYISIRNKKWTLQFVILHYRVTVCSQREKLIWKFQNPRWKKVIFLT